MGLNTFIDLLTPSGPGVGPAVDVSALSEGATMVTVGPGDGEVVLEISCDGGANFAPVTQSLTPNPPSKILTSRTNRDIADPQDGKPTSTGGVVAQYARAKRLTGGGGSKVSLASATTTRNLFATLSKVPISTVSMGPFKTIVVCGSYAGQVVVEGSTDGTNYDAVAMFDTGGSDVRCVEGSFVAMRLRPSASTPSGSVSVGSGFIGGVIGTGVLQFDSVRVVGTKLASFDTSGLPQGTVAYVGNDTYEGKNSVHDDYRLVYGEGLTVDTTLGLDVVNSPTFSLDGAQWIRLEIFNQEAAQKSFWSLDPANSTGLANDENNGWGATQAAADLVPLLTMAELKRRTAGSRYVSTVVFHQLSSATIGDPLDVSTSTGNGYPVWLGKKTTVFPTDGSTVALTTYTAANPAGSTGVQVSLSSLPTSFTASGLVGLCIESADGTRCAMIQKDLGAKTARITQPCNPDAVNYGPTTPQVFTPNEQVRVVSFPRLPCAPFSPDGTGYCGLSDVTLESTDYTDYDFGGWILYGARLVTAGEVTNLRGRNSNYLHCAQYGPGTLFLGGDPWYHRFCGARGANIWVTFGALFIVSHSPADFQASGITLQDGMLLGYGIEADFGVFDSPGIFLGHGPEGGPGQPIRFNSATHLYGTGNVGYLIDVSRGTNIYFFPSANCFATTAAAKPINFVGVEKNYSDLPLLDAANLAAVWVAP